MKDIEPPSPQSAEANMMEKLIEALRSRAGYETKNHRRTTSQYRLIGSVPGERQADWLSLVEQMLAFASEHEVPLDVSKSYFLVEGQLRFGWRIIVKSDRELDAKVASLTSVIEEHAVPKATHYRLNARPGRNELVRGKGVQPSTHAVVGRPSAQREGML